MSFFTILVLWQGGRRDTKATFFGECSCPFKGEAWGLLAGGVQQTSVEKVAIEICVEAKEVVEGSNGRKIRAEWFRILVSRGNWNVSVRVGLYSYLECGLFRVIKRTPRPKFHPGASIVPCSVLSEATSISRPLGV
ncbi:hypothetical protein CsSME_00002385 [Camellia sinensis var. sinensis]